MIEKITIEDASWPKRITKKLNEIIDRVNEIYAVLPKKEKEEWPTKDDKYWFISGDDVDWYFWNNDGETGSKIRSNLGIFHTKEEAEKRRDQIKTYLKTLND